MFAGNTPCGPTPDAKMSSIARPQKVYDFTAHARRQPTAPPPGDRIDAQLPNHADAITAVQLAVEQLQAAQTKPIDVEAPVKALLAQAEREVDAIKRPAGYVQALADQTQRQIGRDVRRSRSRPRRRRSRRSAAGGGEHPRRCSRALAQLRARPGDARPWLWRRRFLRQRRRRRGCSVSADYAQVAIEWAEHMPDTIPPNILAINAITGEHWSSPLVGDAGRQCVRHAGLVVHGRVARPGRRPPRSPRPASRFRRARCISTPLSA